MADETTPAAAAPATPPAAPNEPWYAGAEPELVGHIQNKGWDKLTPAEVAKQAAKAHLSAERMIGVPADQILRLPKDPADVDGWKAVRAKLGAVSDPKAVDLTGVKSKDGTDIPGADADFYRGLAVELGLTPLQARALAEKSVGFFSGRQEAEGAEMAAKLAQEKDALAKNWGANARANLFVAQQAAGRLGIDSEAVEALEKVVGYSRVMEMFRSLGEKLGEARYIQNPAAGGSGAMTREQAVAKKTELMSDRAWASRYLEGGKTEAREMEALNILIVGDDRDRARYA
jgi:hypothetical protein